MIATCLLTNLSGQYFYKTSRTYLRDAQTSDAVDFVFGYTGDLSLPPPKSKNNAITRMSTGSTSQQSQTPLPNGKQPRDSLGSFGLDGLGAAPNHMNASSPFPPAMPVVPMPVSRPSLERQVSVHQATLTELASLRTTVEQQNAAIQQLQYDVRMLVGERMQSNRGAMQIAGPAQGPGGGIEPTRNNELETLREENRNMKERLSTIATAMGLAAADGVTEASTNGANKLATRPPESALGKRKRMEDDPLPTPHSTQSSNGGREGFYGGPYFPAIQHTSEEAEVILGEDARWDDQDLQNTASNGPVMAMNQPAFPQLTVAHGDGAVEFSDDEVAGVHFPSVEPVAPARETIQQYRARMRALHGPSPAPSVPESIHLELPGPIDMDQAEHWGMADVERLIEEEKMPPPPKEPREPKERIQSTEKYLNQELEELGLTEWIGKDKRDPTYKAAIHAARTARKEAKKMEALAAKGLKSAPLPQPGSREMSGETSDEDSSGSPVDISPNDDQPAPVPSSAETPSFYAVEEPVVSETEVATTKAPTRSKSGRASVVATASSTSKSRAATPSARSRRSARKTEPLADNNAQQSNKKPRAKQRGRKSEPAVKAATPRRSPDEDPATPAPKDQTEPLAEITSQYQNKALVSNTEKQPGRSGKKAKTTAAKVLDEAETAQENQPEERMMTRRQQRAAQIQKMDQMAQEAMEMEEA